MALTPEQFERLKKKLANEQVAKQIFTNEKPGLMQGIKNDFSNRVGKAQYAQDLSITGKQTLGSGALQTVGQGAGFVGDIGFQAVKAVTPKIVEDAVSSGITKVTNTAPAQYAISTISAWAKAHPEAAANLGSIVDIASIIPAVKGAQVANKAVLNAAESTLDSTVRTTTKLIDKVPNIIKPKPTPSEAVGQIVQGQTKDIKQAVETFKNIDTSGVKTYGDLSKKMTEKVADLASIVDNELAKDQTRKLLDNLTVTLNTKSGKQVTANYVDTALNHLDELYETTGDIAKKADVEELINNARTKGLTKQEVNDISRVYGQEFGQKAFSKTGDPLTSVNAQRYENVRTGLKETARQGIGGAAAKQADKVMSSILNTQTLVKKNIEAVNKFKQRITERDLLEKLGYNIAKATDILTGGSLRGIIGGLLPRGAGYKVMNALDLEERLADNLKIINQAVKSGAESDIVKALDSLKGKINNLNKTLDKNVPVKPIIDKARGKGLPNREGGFIKTNMKSVPRELESLAKEAKKYKSAEEFVKSQLEKNSFVTDKPIKIYRGEGKGIGNATLVKGQYFADSEKFASTFGKVSTTEIPKGTKVFDFDKIKSNPDQMIIPKQMLVDPDTLTSYLIKKGFEVTKNTNSRGVEYVFLKNQPINELAQLAKNFDDKLAFLSYLSGKGYDKYKDILKEIRAGDTDLAWNKSRGVGIKGEKLDYYPKSPLEDLYNKATGNK